MFHRSVLPSTTTYCLLVAMFSICALALLLPVVVRADFSHRPLVVDETLGPRDIATTEITIENPDDRRYRLYATVNAIDIDNGGTIERFISPSMDDRERSLTSWIEVTRGRIELPPGETITVPVTIRVNPYAKPGQYHAFVGFVPASKRPTAEATALAGEAKGTVFRVEVPENRQTVLRLAGFSVDRFMTGMGAREVTYEVENPGDTPVAPRGELIYYDGRGREVAAVPLNEIGATVAPGETAAFTAPVPVDALAGRFKALLNVQYGETQVASLNDSAHFVLLPAHLLLMLLAALSVLGVVLTVLLRRALGDTDADDDADDVALFVRDGHSVPAHEHDVSLK